MDWNAVALMFSCVAMNHMGLISAIEQQIGHELPIINCTKCSVFWITLIYGIYSTKAFIIPVAMAFLYSYIALWLELLMGYIDSIYLKLYGKIVSTAGDDTSAADTDDGDTAGTVS